MSEPDLFGETPTEPTKESASLYVSRGPAIASAFGGDAVAVLTGPALSDVIAERIGQIERLGHSLETDESRGPFYLGDQARQRLVAAVQQILPGERQDRHVARKNFVRAAALILAALDSLDRIPALPGAGPGAAISPPQTDGGPKQLHIPAMSAGIRDGASSAASSLPDPDDIVFDPEQEHD